MTSLADSLIARVLKQRDLIQAMDEHCRSIKARVTSRDRNVSAEVDGYGAMTGLWLGPGAYTLGAQRLADVIVETARAAAAVAAERQAVLSEQFAERLHELQHASLTCWDGTAFEPSRDSSPG